MLNTSIFFKLTTDRISKVYYGKDRCCRCGCGGDYTYTSNSSEIQSYYPVDDELVSIRLLKAKNLVLRGSKVEFGKKWINVVVECDTALTFYIN